MNIELWKFVFQVLQALATAGVGIYVWWSNREKVTNTRFSGHDKRLAALENSINALASEIKRHPDCPHHDGFENRLDALHGDIRELSGGVKGLTRAVDLMNEFLINQGRLR